MTKKILIIGANGFIGSYITGKLLKNNFNIVCAVRDVEATKLKFPMADVIDCDFNKDIVSDIWSNRLINVDMVINVAGLLTSSGKNKIENVHIYGPQALFDACVKAKIKRIIHISALGIDDEYSTDYALTKKSAENYLKSLNNIDWVILQPSLVYATGSYGGTSLFRALSVLPFFIFLVGDGEQKFQPIHMDDLTDVVLSCIKKNGNVRRTLKVAGSQTVTFKQILVQFRTWLGLSNAVILKIPLFLIQVCVKLGDTLGIQSLNRTSYKMLMQHNVVSEIEYKESVEFSGIRPRSFEQGMTWDPLTVQSLWHARLFFLKPIIKIILGLFWVVTGLITSILAPDLGLNILKEIGFSESLSNILLYSSCLVDIVLGLLLIFSSRVSTICLLQIIVIFIYSVLLSYLKPELWLDPLGPLTKNIPIILLTFVVMAIERDR